MNKTEETGGRERSIAATWRRKNRSEKLYFPLPRVTSARLKVNSCKYSSSSSLIIIYSILLLLFENFKTIQKISNKRKKEKEQNCNKNTNSRKWKFDRRGTVTITKKKGRDRVCRGDARCEMEDNWPTWVVGVGAYKKESLSLHEIARTCTNEQLRVLWQAANSSISHVFARICPRPSPFPSHSLSLFHTLLLLSPVRLLFCFTDSVSFRPRDTPFHRPRYSSRYSTRLGTYVWLREMLSCISSRMFDGALLFKHGARH